MLPRELVYVLRHNVDPKLSVVFDRFAQKKNDKCFHEKIRYSPLKRFHCSVRVTSAPSSIEMLTSAPWKSRVPKLMTCAQVNIWCRSSFTRSYSLLCECCIIWYFRDSYDRDYIHTIGRYHWPRYAAYDMQHIVMLKDPNKINETNSWCWFLVLSSNLMHVSFSIFSMA